MCDLEPTLRDLREVVGLTQEQLGRKLVLTAARVAAWEAGTARPTRLQAGRLAMTLGVRESTVRAAVATGQGV